MIHLEKRFLNDGESGLDEARRELQNLIFLELVGDEWDEDRQKFGFEAWIDSQVNEAIYNATVPYQRRYRASGSKEHVSMERGACERRAPKQIKIGNPYSQI